MTPRHVILFDIDGTLISSAGAGKAALEAALASEFGIPRISDQLELSGRTDRAIVADLLRFHSLGESEDLSRRLLQAYLHHLPSHLHQRGGRILPGIRELLDRLREQTGLALGLLTGNLRAGARIKLGHFGLFDHFAFGGFGDHHLDRDDVAREAYAEVRHRFGNAITPEQIWIIGDTPLDIRCARAIGARAVAVTTGWHSREELQAHQPDLLFDDLSDPRHLLHSLETQAS